MAETSEYYPLHPLKSCPECSISPGPSPEQQLLMKDADLSRPSNSVRDSPEPCSGFRAPSRPQRSRKDSLTNCLPPWRTLRMQLEMALLPLTAIAYLAFCYTAHGRVVPVLTYGLYPVESEHLATIKAGITSISLIIISIALYPIYNMIFNLKSEEFFRVLESCTQGVPLETINHISNPSFGNIDTMIAIWKHRCSNYYTLAIVTSLLAWVVATLAPGVLTMNSIFADGELMAFAIGAVTPQSVLESLDADTAASITWAEMEVGAQYSFGVANTSRPEYAAFIVPASLDVSTGTTARWLSDVIGIKPTCSWASTNLTPTVQLPFNFSSTEFDTSITAHLLDECPFSLFHQSICHGSGHVTNHTTTAPATDGSTVFLLGNCLSGCSPTYNHVDLTLDLTGLNTTFTITFTDQTWFMAILACLSNITIETREVRNDGQGVLHVQPLSAGRKLSRQGNLNTIQTISLFSVATMKLSESAGPLYGEQVGYASIGSHVQGDVLFGKARFENLPGSDAPNGTLVTISPVPIEDITRGYTQILQSAAKSYLAGYLGTAYVPGRISNSELVFATSTSILAVSTVLFALLTVLIIIAHFRPGRGVEFTLANVAATMHGSELPAQFAQIKGEEMAAMQTDVGVEGEADTEVATAAASDVLLGNRAASRVGGNTPSDNRRILEVWGERRIFMQRRSDGSAVLHMN